MRLHADTLTASDIYNAARIARADVDLTRHGSRSRDHAFNVTLRGESNRKPNYGTSRSADRFSSDKAATWDQWGVFLSVLFDEDPTLTTAYYEDRAVFDRFTANRFNPEGSERATDADSGETSWFWPVDAHGDHTFRYFGGMMQCAKCTAKQVREN